MLYLILASVVFLVGLFALGFALFGKDGEYTDGAEVRRGGWIVVVTCGVVLAALTVAFSATTVGARSVGIQTAFGKYEDTLSNGFQWTAPWSNVEEFSTQVQPLDLEGGGAGAVAVNFQGGGRGNVEATVRWQINPENAEDLWKKYRTFERVRDQLVASSAKDSFRVVIGKYTPNEARSGENLRLITQSVVKDLEGVVGRSGVVVESVSLKSISLDESTQKSLERTVVANNNVETARAEQERARIDAETAKIRQAAGVLSGPALVRYCLEVTNSWDTNKNGPLPAGWQCFGSASNFVVTGK